MAVRLYDERCSAAGEVKKSSLGSDIASANTPSLLLVRRSGYIGSWTSILPTFANLGWQ